MNLGNELGLSPGSNGSTATRQAELQSTLERLHSFDADLRLMALSDLRDALTFNLNQVRSSRVPPLAGLRKDAGSLAMIQDGVVAMLFDQIVGVQTQAVAVLGPLASSIAPEAISSLTEAVAKLPQGEIHELAIRTLIDSSPLDAAAPVVTQCLHDARISLSSGRDPKLAAGQSGSTFGVLTAAINRFITVLPKELLSDIFQFLLLALEQTPSGLRLRRIVESIAIVRPRLDDVQLNTAIEFCSAQLQSNEPLAALLVVSSSPHMFDPSTYGRLRQLASDFESVDVAEAALSAATAILPTSAELSRDLKDLAVSAIRYQPMLINDNGEGEDGGDDLMSDSDAEANEEEFWASDDDDDSWRIRRAGCRLASQYFNHVEDADAGLADCILSAVRIEQSEGARLEMFETLETPRAAITVVERIQEVLVLAGRAAFAGSAVLLVCRAAVLTGRPINDDNIEGLAQVALARVSLPQQMTASVALARSLIDKGCVMPGSKAWPLISQVLDKALAGSATLVQEAGAAASAARSSYHLTQLIEIARSSKEPASASAALSCALDLLSRLPADSADSQIDLLIGSVILPEITGQPTSLTSRKAGALALCTLLESTNAVPFEIACSAAEKCIDLLLPPHPRSLAALCLRAIGLLVQRSTLTEDIRANAAQAIIAAPELQVDHVCDALKSLASEQGVAEYALDLVRTCSYTAPLAPSRDRHNSIVDLMAAVAKTNAQFKATASKIIDERVCAEESGYATSEEEDCVQAGLSEIAAAIGCEPQSSYGRIHDLRLAIYCALNGAVIDTLMIIESPLLQSSESYEAIQAAGYAIGAATVDMPDLSVALNGLPDALAIHVLDAYASLRPAPQGADFELHLRQWTTLICERGEALYNQEDVFAERALGRVFAALLMFDEVAGRSPAQDLAYALSTPNPVVNSAVCGLRGALANAKSDTFRASLLVLLRNALNAVGAEYGGGAAELGDARQLQVKLLSVVAWVAQKSFCKESRIDVGVTDELATVIRSAAHKDDRLIRVLQLGPFRHRIDDGAVVRKAAHEALYLLESDHARRVLLDAALEGLADEPDIQVLSAHAITRLAQQSPHVVVPRLKEIREALATAEKGTTVRESQVKQEHDTRLALKGSLDMAAQALASL